MVATWTGTKWFIEGDISDCFGSLDHQIMIEVLAERIHDGRFLRLIERMLQAGYLEDWRWNATLSDAPKGGTTHRLLAGKCEICGARNALQVHHLRKLADLNRPGGADRPPWVELTARRRRKTLVVCSTCHHDIHNGRGTAIPRK